MRQPGILGLHCSTSANALRYAYEATTLPETRLVMALQGVGWMCQFQKAIDQHLCIIRQACQPY
jgi:hypothetical protein